MVYLFQSVLKEDMALAVHLIVTVQMGLPVILNQEHVIV